LTLAFSAIPDTPSSSEIIDVITIVDCCAENYKAAAKLYEEKFPNKHFIQITMKL